MRYFGHPIEWDAENRTNVIFNDLARMNFIAVVMTDNSKPKIRGCDFLKIGSAAEKIPDSINVSRNFLDSFDGVYSHEYYFFATDCTDFTDGCLNFREIYVTRGRLQIK